MARLVVNPGSPAAWEIQLKPGTNSLGRDAGNDFTIADPSVSSCHCQIVVGEDGAIIKDLGSTNGTFINRAPVREATLQAGQIVRLGAVEIVFEDGSPAAKSNATPPPGPRPYGAPATETGVPAVIGLRYCKFHPSAPAHYLCNQCAHAFCEACIGRRRAAGVVRIFCRHCGTECVPIRAEVQEAVERGFFSRWPGALGFPLRGPGVFVIIAGIMMLALIKGGYALMSLHSLRFFLLGIFLQVSVFGYFFTWVENIIQSTVAEDRELPGLPGFRNYLEDLLMPFCKFLGLSLLCFSPGLALMIWLPSSYPPWYVLLPWGAFLLGFVYLPMALLSVTVFDSVMAANPLLVVPSILKVIIQYVATLTLLAAAFGFRYGASVLIDKLFPESWTTESMAQLIGLIGMLLLTSSVTVYLLMVGIHLLGLVYVTKKDSLGWELSRGK
jgi:hypothetical protein